jgi:hypothetical protein
VDRYTLRLLQARLARDRASAAWLQAAPESHGAPPGLLQITRLPPAR